MSKRYIVCELRDGMELVEDTWYYPEEPARWFIIGWAKQQNEKGDSDQ